MTAPFADLTSHLAAKRTISPQDVLALRRVAWPDGKIDAGEAEAILALNQAVSMHAAEWSDFVIEAMTAYLIDQAEPRGYIDGAKADWLIARIDADGQVDSLTELELLVKLLERATAAPERLKAYALTQIERAVLSGAGPTRDGGDLTPGVITAHECALLRRLVFAAGGDAPAMVSAAEAEMLFRLKDATLGAANAPEWPRLFVQAVGNFLLAEGAHEPLSRSRAAELEAFMNDRRSNVGRFLGRMAGQVGQVPRFGRKGAAAPLPPESVSTGEQQWLDAHLDADGQLDAIERQLLDFLKTNGRF